MEQLLLLWIKEKQLVGDSVSEAIVCEKAGAIFQDLKRDVTETEGESSQGDIAWKGVTKRTLNSAWGKLWPDVVLKREGFEGFEPIEEEIVSIGRSKGLEVDEADVADLIEEYAEELTTEELKELQKISHSGVVMELSSEEEVEPKEKLTSREISDILGKWQEVSDFVEKRDPEKLSTGRASALFDDRCLTFFHNILKRRQKQTSLDRYLVKVSRIESQESEVKMARRSSDD
ncbi:tigger transposable element-derived protein 1 [Nephila pilipes]|uniref:Tigger transposable element-derived protein 1 n=1 Tax=Nephila pilipes TaxID=299642 RepID=A0A8X6PUW8_NEPPI|nr:tigger transposable element-derived protein 1 [Nephila pilipes]